MNPPGQRVYQSLHVSELDATDLTSKGTLDLANSESHTLPSLATSNVTINTSAAPIIEVKTTSAANTNSSSLKSTDTSGKLTNLSNGTAYSESSISSSQGNSRLDLTYALGGVGASAVMRAANATTELTLTNGTHQYFYNGDNAGTLSISSSQAGTINLASGGVNHISSTGTNATFPGTVATTNVLNTSGKSIAGQNAAVTYEHTATFSVPNGVISAIPFNTVAYNRGGFTIVNGTITFPETGIYILSSNVSWPGLTNTQGVGLIIEVVGVHFDNVTQVGVPGFNTRQSITQIVRVTDTTTQVARVKLYQQSGGTLTINAGAHIAIVKLCDV